MRGLLLIPLILGLGNCSGSMPRGSSTYAPAPPAVTLVSRAGTQHAVQGSSCIQGNGSGRCADSGYPFARQLSVVRPGERVRIRIAGAKSIAVTLHPLYCPKRVLGRASVGPDGTWRAPKRPGLYQVEVFARFAGNGVTGDTTAGLGLWVDRSHRLELVRAKTVYPAACR